MKNMSGQSCSSSSTPGPNSPNPGPSTSMYKRMPSCAPARNHPSVKESERNHAPGIVSQLDSSTLGSTAAAASEHVAKTSVATTGGSRRRRGRRTRTVGIADKGTESSQLFHPFLWNWKTPGKKLELKCLYDVAKCVFCEDVAGQEPKMTPCLHTLCSETCPKFLASVSVRSGKSKCPKCLRTFNSTKLEPHYFLTLPKLTDKVEVEICAHNKCAKGNQPEYQCANCDSKMCKDCNDEHHANEQTKNHVSVEKDVYDLLFRLNSEEICPTHPNLPLVTFCHSCKKNLCYECNRQLIENHNPKTHYAIATKDRARNLLTAYEFPADVKEITQYAGIASSFIANLEQQLTETQTLVDQSLRSVKRIVQLPERWELLWSTEFKQKLLLKKIEVNAYLSQVEQLKSLTKVLKNGKIQRSSLANDGIIKAQMERLKKVGRDVISSTDEVLTLKLNPNPDQFIKVINEGLKNLCQVCLNGEPVILHQLQLRQREEEEDLAVDVVDAVRNDDNEFVSRNSASTASSTDDHEDAAAAATVAPPPQASTSRSIPSSTTQPRKKSKDPWYTRTTGRGDGARKREVEVMREVSPASSCQSMPKLSPQRTPPKPPGAADLGPRHSTQTGRRRDVSKIPINKINNVTAPDTSSRPLLLKSEDNVNDSQLGEVSTQVRRTRTRKSRKEVSLIPTREKSQRIAELEERRERTKSLLPPSRSDYFWNYDRSSSSSKTPKKQRKVAHAKNISTRVENEDEESEPERRLRLRVRGSSQKSYREDSDFSDYRDDDDEYWAKINFQSASQISKPFGQREGRRQQDTTTPNVVSSERNSGRAIAGPSTSTSSRARTPRVGETSRISYKEQDSNEESEDSEEEPEDGPSPPKKPKVDNAASKKTTVSKRKPDTFRSQSRVDRTAFEETRDARANRLSRSRSRSQSIESIPGDGRESADSEISQGPLRRPTNQQDLNELFRSWESRVPREQPQQEGVGQREPSGRNRREPDRFKGHIRLWDKFDSFRP